MIGDAEHTHIAVTPRLRGTPFDRIIAVVDLMAIRVKRAFRCVPAPHVLELEAQLRQRLETPVAIRVRGRDRGQIVIDFNSRDELERVAGLIRG